MLKKIKTSDIRMGMYIHKFCGSWMDHPFMRSSFLLAASDDLHKIKSSRVLEIVIDTSKGLDIATADIKPEAKADVIEEDVTFTPKTTVEVAPVQVGKRSREEEIARAAKLCASSKQAVMDMFAEVRMGKAVDLGQAQELVNDMSESMLREPGALVSLARLKNADEYTYMHSVAVSVLMIALAHELKLDEQLVRDAGMAGLLHDVGKMFVADDILNKPGKLTDDEYFAIQKHPEFGYEILRKSEHVSELAKIVCLHHHEKYDGTGYPHRQKGEEIHLLARMGAICDVYDAITSNRPYKAGWDPAESIRRMAEWKGHFDTHVFQNFVKTMGIYPVGALVRLASGRLAVVYQQHHESLLTPVVKVFYSVKSDMQIEQHLIDLAKGTDKIIAREPLENWNFPNLEELWTGMPSPMW